MHIIRHDICNIKGNKMMNIEIKEKINTILRIHTNM